MTPEPCICCGNESSLLCDYVIGMQIGRTLPRPAIISIDAERWTCDAPLCSECATHSGNIFFDGSAAFTGVESIDYCPVHAQLMCPDQHKVREGYPMCADDAAYLRRQVFAELRRWRMRQSSPNRAATATPSQPQS